MEKTLTKRTVVLGREVLEEVWADRARLEISSYMNPGPRRLGVTEQKMTADKCRSVGTIQLVITLIRLWGHEIGRKRDMLFNFMHLISALHIASMRSTSKAHIEKYTYHYKAYLEGYVQLYKEAAVHPNHHLCLHLGLFLRLFGPVHSWRAWVFERFNYMLQNIKTNSKSGMKICLTVDNFPAHSLCRSNGTNLYA